jgi:hypothetical protein
VQDKWAHHGRPSYQAKHELTQATRGLPLPLRMHAILRAGLESTLSLTRPMLRGTPCTAALHSCVSSMHSPGSRLARSSCLCAGLSLSRALRSMRVDAVS